VRSDGITEKKKKRADLRKTTPPNAAKIRDKDRSMIKQFNDYTPKKNMRKCEKGVYCSRLNESLEKGKEEASRDVSFEVRGVVLGTNNRIPGRESFLVGRLQGRRGTRGP